jgi:hypothetical protein
MNSFSKRLLSTVCITGKYGLVAVRVSHRILIDDFPDESENVQDSSRSLCQLGANKFLARKVNIDASTARFSVVSFPEAPTQAEEPFPAEVRALFSC